MELTKEFIESNKLSEEQVTAISGFGKTFSDNLVADTKKEYDGLANKNAEAIISDVSKGYAEITGVERNEGEKFKDYFTRGWSTYSKTEKEKLATATAEYEAKVKDFKGDEATASELAKAKEALDELKRSTADFDKFKADAEKYGALSESHGKLKLEVSFGQVKPVFPESVNTFEAEAKWNEFKANILKDNTIEIVEGEAIVISKENEYKQEKLKDLVAKDTVLSALLEGRNQKGLNGKEVEMSKVDGLPFDVPADAKTDAKTRTKAIREQLAKEGVGQTDTAYSKKFAEYNSKIMKQQTAA